jgi:predicted regulator of Ras-like GTPase activity (Roadblock/LC7/MglB family)
LAIQEAADSRKDHPELALKLTEEARPQPEPAKEPAEAKKEEGEKAADAEPKPLETVDIKGRKEKNEAKDILARANALPGIAACALTFADGLGLAGNLPGEIKADGLCAMAPSLMRKVERYMQDTKLGALTALTLHCEKAPISFFMQGNICLSALQTGTELAPETRKELVEMTKTLSRTYTQPEIDHVDH